MVAPKTSPSQFQNTAPPWSLSTLDTNFTNLDNAISNANNYSNYLADTGAANAYVVTFPGTVTVSLAAGLTVDVLAVHANTGASTLNVNGTGAIAIVNQDGTAIAAGQIAAGGIFTAKYDGTHYQMISSSQPFLQGGTGAVARTMQNKVRETVSFTDFGAVGDGVTNNRTALVNAVAYCKLTGSALLIPAGNFVIDTTAGSVTLEYITIIGEGVLDGSATPAAAGSVLSITGTANTPFLMRRGVTFNGIAFYYPNQVDTPTPVVYPPTISIDTSDGAVQFCYIQNCVVFNAYRFLVDTDATGAIGHIFIENNTIYGILTCFEFAYNSEIIKFIGNSFTFGHWLAATEGGCRGYTRANGSVMIWTRTDGFVFSQNMCFGYLNAVNLSTVATLCQLMNIEDNLFDQVRYPIVASGTGNFSGSQIVGNSFICFNSQNTTLQGHAIGVTTSGNAVAEVLTVAGNTFNTCTEDAVIVSGNTPIRQLTFSANTFTAWAAYKVAGSYGALNISGSSTSYMATGNTFLSQIATYASGILGTCSTALVSGNVFGGCQVAINATYTSISTSGNISYNTGGTASDVINATNIYQVNNLWDKASGNTTRPAFNLSDNSTTSYSSGVAATVTFNTADFDRGTNVAASVFTAPKTGRYQFSWHLGHDNTSTAGDRFTVYLTPSDASRQHSWTMVLGADFGSMMGSALLQLTAGVTVTLQIAKLSGTGVFKLVGDRSLNCFGGEMIE